MGRKPSYIFTNKRHSNRAVMSTILGIISTLSLVAVIYLTYVQEGNAPMGYGVTGLLIAIFSLTGLILGVITVREKDRYKLFPCLGILFNLVALFGIGLVVYAGMYL
ncbi:MAG: DUF6142 family protein [Lachnospiraceae bacterium]